MDRIDAHAHINGDDSRTLACLEEMGLKVMNICVAHNDWREGARTAYRALARAHPQRYGWCTTFDLPDYTVADSEYADRAIAELDNDFRDGAVAVKAWKNIGMELRSPDGAPVLIDDPIFDPVYEHVASVGKPMLMHIGEPLECWLPLREGSVHYGYYSRHPEWHMHERTDLPSHQDLMQARDRVLARHPSLRVIGAHLGSLEYDVAQIADRFDRYPNFAVDVSARLADLMAQPAQKVREFFLRYPERILFGTDIVSRQQHSDMESPDLEAWLAEFRTTNELYYRYFETSATVGMWGQESEGIQLPADVLERFYTLNARAWYPGL